MKRFALRCPRFPILTVLILMSAVCPLAAADEPPNRVTRERPPLVVPVLWRGPLEKSFMEIEADVPGFAGWYKENDGSTVVLLKDNAHADKAIERVSRILDTIEKRGGRSAEMLAVRQVNTRPALYSFRELAGFRHLMQARLPDGVYTVDVDEVNNVLKLGVRDHEVEQQVRAIATRLRVPDTALRVDLQSPPELRAALNAYHRPIRSGLGVTFPQSQACTVGINSIWDNDPTWVGFFTASHCGTQYTITGTVFSQGGSRIGYEADDVLPTSSQSCPSGDLCRYSDTAWVAFDYANRATLNGYNTLALPSWSAYGSAGATDFDSVVTIAGEALPYPYIGDQVFKVGQTSGWTYGYILGTCEDVTWPGLSYNGSRVWFLCQERSDVYSTFGDSGSGVFTWDYVNNEYVALFTGILWGGPNALETWHSSSWNIGVDFPQYTYYY